jgi:hypothetical protein
MSSKKRFLKDEFWVLSWNASVQRAGLYKQNSTKENRDTFRREIIAYIKKELLDKYKTKVTHKTHCKNIEKLSKEGSKLGRKVLVRKKYKIGVAQKLLNLQLKYLWCADEIAEPPHCPVDRVIINKTDSKGTAWTKIEIIEEYKKVIKSIEKEMKESGISSLSEWELINFQRPSALKEHHNAKRRTN